MSKANSPRTRPEVAKKTADQAADMYDFVQAPEWQKVLEKARIEREKNLAVRAQTGKEAPKSKPDRRRADQSTAGERTQGAQKPWTARVEEARHKRNEVLARRAAESKETTPGKPDVRRKKVSANSAEQSLPGAARQKDKPTIPEQASRGNPGAGQPKAVAAPGNQSVKQSDRPDHASVRDDAHERDLTRAELSLILSSEEVDHRLSKKLLQKLEDHQRRRRRVRVGLVALGCTIGVVASSSVFLTLSGWRSSGSTERAVSEATDGAIPPDFVQAETLQPDVMRGAEGEAVISADLLDASDWQMSSDTGATEGEGVSSLASLVPPSSDLPERAEIAEPRTASLAPSVLSYVPALERPLLPVGGAGYLPRREANPSFLPYEFTPEFFDTSISSTDEVSAITDPVLVSLDPINPSQSALSPSLRAEVSESSAPNVAPNILPYIPTLQRPMLPVGGVGYLPRQEANPSFLPYEFTPEFFATSIGLADEASAITDPVFVSLDPIIPPQRAPNVSLQLGALDTPSPLAPAEGQGVLEGQSREIQSDHPLSANPIENALKVVLTDPSVLLEDVALSPPTQQPLALTLVLSPSDSTELAALPDGDVGGALEPIPGVRGAEFRLYAPNKIPNDAVETVVAELTTTGHELSGTARVGYKVTQSNVRFYHRQDAAKAAALAEDAGALLRDFTDSKSKTPSGVVELYLAGEGLGQAPVKRAAKKSRQNTTPSSTVNQLRSQVLKKLRTTTN